MSTFDPSSVRDAVATFTPRRPPRFHELSSAKEVIIELRQKHASYRAIADLLTQHCLPVSKTAVAAFCHLVLGESVRPRRKSARRRTGEKDPVKVVGESTGEGPQPAPPAGSAKEADAAEPTQPRSRGPRIAQVRMVHPPQS